MHQNKVFSEPFSGPGGISYKEKLLNEKSAKPHDIVIDVPSSVNALSKLHDRALIGRVVNFMALRTLNVLIMKAGMQEIEIQYVGDKSVEEDQFQESEGVSGADLTGSVKEVDDHDIGGNGKDALEEGEIRGEDCIQSREQHSVDDVTFHGDALNTQVNNVASESTILEVSMEVPEENRIDLNVYPQRQTSKEDGTMKVGDSIRVADSEGIPINEENHELQIDKEVRETISLGNSQWRI
ncbi:hypothetical protein L1987_39217 [Smallanthus sonchifolius]|uniref:Uncharacterized protein n=1 Tax=Smallanthus sonchifolius TaxID=185202 RepID=A0ACB9HNX3_9ASTR|nr:hypothetical protein L1987_39217 [Smallanthus sonchifolius]